MGGRGAFYGLVARRGRVPVVAIDKLFHRLHLIEDIGHVEKGRLFQADIDEGRLHAGEHPDDLPLVDVAHDSPLPAAFDIQLGDVAVLQQGHPGLVGGLVDDQFLGHKTSK